MKLIRMAWNALFLGEAPYTEMRDDPKPVLRGLGLVALVAVIVAVLGVVGMTLEWATSPSLDDIQQAVLEGMQRMPWWDEMQRNPEAGEMFEQMWDMNWRIFPNVFGAPSVASGVMRIVGVPLRLVIAWLLFGLVAHLLARVMGGQGSLPQTLGATALAVAPQLFNVVAVLPYVVIGGVVGTWTLLSRYVAVKTSHELTPGRALAATLLPYVAYYIVASLFFCVVSAIVGALTTGGMPR